MPAEQVWVFLFLGPRILTPVPRKKNPTCSPLVNWLKLLVKCANSFHFGYIVRLWYFTHGMNRMCSLSLYRAWRGVDVTGKIREGTGRVDRKTGREEGAADLVWTAIAIGCQGPLAVLWLLNIEMWALASESLRRAIVSFLVECVSYSMKCEVQMCKMWVFLI